MKATFIKFDVRGAAQYSMCKQKQLRKTKNEKRKHSARRLQNVQHSFHKTCQSSTSPLRVTESLPFSPARLSSRVRRRRVVYVCQTECGSEKKEIISQVRHPPQDKTVLNVSQANQIVRQQKEVRGLQDRDKGADEGQDNISVSHTDLACHL